MGTLMRIPPCKTNRSSSSASALEKANFSQSGGSFAKLFVDLVEI
jgi:hypothetical protein